jgi:hypothetical protein
MLAHPASRGSIPSSVEGIISLARCLELTTANEDTEVPSEIPEHRSKDAKKCSEVS